MRQGLAGLAARASSVGGGRHCVMRVGFLEDSTTEPLEIFSPGRLSFYHETCFRGSLGQNGWWVCNTYGLRANRPILFRSTQGLVPAPRGYHLIIRLYLLFQAFAWAWIGYIIRGVIIRAFMM